MNEQAWVPRLPDDDDVPSRSFVDAWDRGRARRRRRLLASGGSTAALGAALVLGLAAVPGPSSGDSLRQIGPAVPGAVAGSSEPVETPTLPERIGPSALPKLPQQLPGLPRTSEPTPSGDPSPDAQADQATGTQRDRDGGTYAGSPSRTVQREYYSSMVHADQNGTSGGAQTVCAPDAEDRPSGQHARWCGGNEIARDKADFLLEHRQCRAHDGDQPALTFATMQEVEYEIRDADGTLLWRWSDGTAVQSAEHELPTERGACYEWITRWTPLAPDGRPLDAGTYLLRTWVTSAELGPQAPYDSEFVIPVQEDA